MIKQKQIVLVEDHSLVRDGFKMLISKHSHLNIIDEAENGVEAIMKIEKIKPDLAIVDLKLPQMNGIDVIRRISKTSPETKVLVCTAHVENEYVYASLEAGAKGFLLKYADQNEVILAINSILNGKSFISPDITEPVINGYLNVSEDSHHNKLWSKLTNREKEVINLIAEGYTSKKIAKLLFISIKTVETHRSNIMKKLNFNNSSQITSFVIKKRRG